MSHHPAIHVRHVKGINNEDGGLYQCYIGRELEMHFRLEESDREIGGVIRHCIMVAKGADALLGGQETP